MEAKEINDIPLDISIVEFDTQVLNLRRMMKSGGKLAYYTASLRSEINITRDSLLLKSYISLDCGRKAYMRNMYWGFLREIEAEINRFRLFFKRKNSGVFRNLFHSRNMYTSFYYNPTVLTQADHMFGSVAGKLMQAAGESLQEFNPYVYTYITRMLLDENYIT